MAGRVLLLGKKQQRRGSSSGTGAGSRAGTPGGTGGGHGSGGGVFGGPGAVTIGCGVPRSLAPNEVEDLSKLATASVVTTLRTQHSVTPELWDVVFGASRSPTSAAGRRAVQQQQQQPQQQQHHQQSPHQQQQPQQQAQSGDADDLLSQAASGLPRIRTRPLGEAAEEGCTGANRGDDGCCSPHSSSGSSSSSSSWMSNRGPVQRDALQHRCSRLSGAASTGALAHNSSSSRSTLHHPIWLRSCFSRQTAQSGASSSSGRSQRHSIGADSSSKQVVLGSGPVAEGLDRSSSLLLRTASSAASTAGPLAGSGLHAGGGSANLAATLQATASGSSNFAAALAQHHVTQQQQVQQVQAAQRQGSGTYGSGLLAAGSSGNFSAALARRASLAGEAASATLEADRAALVAGLIHDDASAGHAGAAAAAATGPGDGRGGLPGRRLCVRWLDELIVALWHDLQAFMEWKVWDQSLREARGGTHAELVLGLVAGDPGTPFSKLADGGSLNPPLLTASDWMRRGALAERLGHVGDARAAYRAAVKLQFNLTSYTALLRLEAQAGSCGDTHLCAAQVLAWHQQCIGQGSGSGSSRAGGAKGGAVTSGSGGGQHQPGGGGGGGGVVVVGVPPEVVGWALGLLADGAGVVEVRAAAPPGTPPDVWDLLEEWQKWRAAQ